jgi:outer membrane protein TolC
MKTLCFISICMFSGVLAAQDTLTLAGCQQMARENAPRLGDLDVIQLMGEARIEQAGTAWYPSLDLNGRVSYQSDVVTVTLTDPNIPVEFPQVPHDQYGLNLDVSQNLFDGGLSRGKKNYEAAVTAADLQQVEVDLYALQERVNRYYFAVLLLQENRRNLEIHLENLEARKEVVQTAVANGTLLDTDLSVLEVERLKVMGSVIELDSKRKSALNALRILCGDQFSEGAVLEHPRLEPPGIASAVRPEYRLFDLKQATMEAGKELVRKKRMPVLYAFGQTGYGKPGYNMLNEQWDYYYMVGAGLKWKVWDWNQSAREKQLIEYQQKMLQTQRTSFDMRLESMLSEEESNMEQYRLTVEMDRQVLELQKKISEQAAVKLENGTMTATEYITELNKENLARITLATHQVLLTQSMANYMTLKGNL